MVYNLKSHISKDYLRALRVSVVRIVAITGTVLSPDKKVTSVFSVTLW